MPSNPRYHSTRKPRRSKWQGVTEANAHIAEETLAADPLGIEDVKPGAGPIMPVPVESKYVSKQLQILLMRRYIEDRVLGDTKEFYEASRVLALGVTVVGKKGVYTRAPDFTVITGLWDRVLGKTTENINITIEGKAPDDATDEEIVAAAAALGMGEYDGTNEPSDD